ncbi:hypothetical protein [Lentzea sp. E54]|uniref:hypothetical protein n=1 Tax=Lentzea xerophila TaxID=3435883 RepID=UPI003DA4185F
MSAWQCGDCHTNNVAGATKCRTCTGTTRKVEVPKPVPKPVPPAVPKKPQPVATPSTVRRSTVPISVTPAPPPPPPPPRPAPPPLRSAPPVRPPTLPPAPPVYRPRGRRRSFWTIRRKRTARLVIGGLLALMFGPSLLNHLARIELPSTASDATTAAGAACPAAVTQFLPGGGYGATLVTAGQTNKHVITVCRTAAGALYYDGQVKGMPADATNHIMLAATATPTGCVAHNAPYRYEINGGRIIVTKAGSVIMEETLRPL